MRVHFVDALALTPTLPRKREREYTSGNWKARGNDDAAGFLPSPACGRGAGVRAGGGNSDGLHFVDIPALTPNLSHKREREYTNRAGDHATVVVADMIRSSKRWLK